MEGGLTLPPIDAFCCISKNRRGRFRQTSTLAQLQKSPWPGVRGSIRLRQNSCLGATGDAGPGALRPGSRPGGRGFHPYGGNHRGKRFAGHRRRSAEDRVLGAEAPSCSRSLRCLHAQGCFGCDGFAEPGRLSATPGRSACGRQSGGQGQTHDYRCYALHDSSLLPNAGDCCGPAYRLTMIEILSNTAPVLALAGGRRFGINNRASYCRAPARTSNDCRPGPNWIGHSFCSPPWLCTSM